MCQRLIDDILYQTGNYYVGFGNGVAWGTPDTPPTEYDNPATEISARTSLIYLKKITSPQVVFGAARYDWVMGTIYDRYDDALSPSNPAYSGATSLQSAKFYVLTPQNNVYKCIDNNYNSPSTVMPTGTSLDYLTTADGYVWKFLYSVPPYLANAFMDATNLPVVRAVQQSFYTGGSINSVTVNNPGSGYTSASVVVNGNGSNATNPYLLQSLTITNAGSGYTSAPTLTFPAPTLVESGAQTASGSTTINASGQVQTATFSATGYGYQTNPGVTVSPPVSSYTAWASGTSVIAGTNLQAGLNYYNVVTGGTTGSTAPTATSGSISDGTATLQFVGTQAVITVNGAVNPAKFTPNIVGGQITSVTVNDPGIGYSTVTLSVSGNGTGAAITANLSSGDLNTSQSNVELTAIKGALSSVVITAGGSGYSQATVAISGDGVGATAVANVVSGAVRSILITNYGSGYTHATATITGDGVGATARVIMAPYSGHGHNAIDELFATNILLQMSIGNELNQGFTPGISYRQILLLKDITGYGANTLYLGTSASACFVAAGAVNTTQFPAGEIITQSGSGAQFLIIASASNGLLLRPLNNAVPTSNTDYQNTGGNTFVPTAITNPDVDVFSGKLLQINSLAPFTPSNTQYVSFNGVLNF